MTPCRPLELASQLEGAASAASAVRLGQGHCQNAQLLGTAAPSLTTGLGSQADAQYRPPATAYPITPAKSFPEIKQRLEAEPSRFLESTVEGSSSASGGVQFGTRDYSLPSGWRRAPREWFLRAHDGVAPALASAVQRGTAE